MRDRVAIRPVSNYQTASFRIGNIIVRPEVNELVKNKKIIRLEDKVMSVLMHLVSNRHRVVSREELFSNVWSDVVVTQDSLNRCISILRKQLNDTKAEDKIIMTFRNRGYRFIGQVNDPIATPVKAKPGIRQKAMYVGSGVALTVLAGLLSIIILCVV